MHLAAYIAALTVTQGAGAGEPFCVLPWQRRFLRRFTRTDGDVAPSIGRGNGKTILIAGIACATLDGPLMQRRAETVIVASSFAQSRIAYKHTLGFLREREHDLNDRKVWRLQDSQNAATVEHRPTGSRVRCIGSDPSRAHGLSPVLVSCDEPAQWPGTTSERMRASLVTSMEKINSSRLIALGTRPADPSHWFQTMLDGGADYAQSHHAREDDPARRMRVDAGRGRCLHAHEPAGCASRHPVPLLSLPARGVAAEPQRERILRVCRHAPPRLRRSDGAAHRLQLFDDLRDLDDLRTCVHQVREVVSQRALDPCRDDAVSPWAAARDDAEIDAVIRESAESAYHPCGTCRMGEDPMSVVDPQYWVHGMEGLRVVDSSIMPSIVSGNLNAPTMMIGDKASDMILGRTPLPPSDAGYFGAA